MTSFHPHFTSPRIRVKEVAALLGCSVSTVWAWAKKGIIPAPQRVGPRFTFWLRSDIEAVATSTANIPTEADNA